MHHLIAKTKGKNGQFLKVFSDENIFDLPTNLNNVFLYSPTYKPEEDEWICLDHFSDASYCPDLLKEPFTSTDYVQIQVAQYNNITYLCSVQDNYYFFQKIQGSSILKRKWFSLSDAPTLVQNQPIILLDKIPDAIYDNSIDRLYFKNLTAISGIFKGIEVLFREATDVETQKFLSHRFISLDRHYTAKDVKPMNRKRITMAEDIWKKLKKDERINMTTDIHDYCPHLKYDDQKHKFVVNDETELRDLLWGLLERYYTTRRGEKRLANSIKKLE